ncbi:MAG: pseudaminic acid synthase [Rhodothermales bacterium]|nr:pseudaminic acid synthase [Rhodothermales bacterium]MBO6781037.1 pseudaminic acid synthase [Rhodothermales bacterium]
MIIAEMSGNHNGSLERALLLVEAAAVAGAHALKLQTYTPDSLTLDVADGDFFLDDADNPWQGRSLYELYQEAQTPWDWHPQIFARSAELGMLCFSTPFDLAAVNFLEDLGSPAYKIASFESNHLPLLEAVASTGKPVIMSTGMATLAELDESVRALRAAGCKDLILLKCTSAYPADASNSNVTTIPHLADMFDCQVGLSDHTPGIGVPVAAVAHGATVIEKHFTLKRSDGGVDSAFSLEPRELQALVLETARAWRSLGSPTYGPTESEQGSRVFRRSLYLSQDVKSGETLGPHNVRIVRPGHGLAPKYLRVISGLPLAKDASRGTALTWDLLEK